MKKGLTTEGHRGICPGHRANLYLNCNGDEATTCLSKLVKLYTKTLE